MEPAAPPPENATQTAVLRATLRREKIAARAALAQEVRAAHSARIETTLEALLDKLRAVPPAPTFRSTLGFCWPHQGEFDARPLVQRLLARGWDACLPVVLAEAAPLAFRPWTPETPLAPDRYGIPTPSAGEFVTPDVLLIPLVAVDARNYRIGYGGGFFDRTLAALAAAGHCATSIGVGFELARVSDTRPGPRDIPLDLVITELGCCIARDLAQ
ncbi:MAG: 5-formyltetrahydrofolate cyclo-ligase [Sulfurisoma sp.]|nr:5-formyltetrahydrofolate cyclo-ligase [Sulfurisoma sp.]